MESVPPPFIPRPTWFDDAACSGLDVNLFFPERGENSTEAKAVCASCPVCDECREYGSTERHGVWGGESIRDRYRLTTRARHGTVARYNVGCRCGECAAAASENRVRRRAASALRLVGGDLGGAA